MKSILPEWLVGNSDNRLFALDKAAILMRAMTEDELAECRRSQWLAEFQCAQHAMMRGNQAMTSDELDEIRYYQMRGMTEDSEMKDKKDSPIPVPNCMPPPRTYRLFDSLKVNLTKEETERLHNSTRVVCNDFGFCGDCDDCDDIGEQMKDKDEGMKDRDMPDGLTKLPHEVYEDVLDNTINDKEVQSLFKSAVNLFFKKLGDILAAIYRRLISLLPSKK